ncbi:hypothetical protein N0V94_005836 [Neodidymelliopsis sp. IMI 364377]|nr:hypothetical protein N0V94_005836 [Neodidymelliopsis sp. IMI 364377]
MEDIIAKLRVLWAAELEYEEIIDLEDNFFELGGDSVAVIRLVSAAYDVGLQISPVDVFAHPTLEALAAVVTESESSAMTNVDAFELLPPESVARLRASVACDWDIDEAAIQDIYPCTPLQEGLMALSVQGNQSYIRQEVFKVSLDVDLQRLQDAWDATIQSTPILRTTIIYDKDEGSQQVVLNNQSSWRIASNLEEYLAEDRQTPMFYGKALTRYAVVGLLEKDQQPYMIWTAHHAIYDGWSLPLILDRVARAYKGESQLPLTPFNHYIAYIQNLDRDENEDFWRKYLFDACLPSFPPSHVQTSRRRSRNTETLCVSLPRQDSRCSFTTPTLVRAAWAIVNSRYSDSTDIVFGATMTGRNAPVNGMSTVVGPTITTVPVRIQLRLDQPINQFLEAVRDGATTTIPYEHFGLQNIKRTSPDAAHACNFQALLVIQPPVRPNAQENVFTNTSTQVSSTFDTYTLIIECVIENDDVHIIANFDHSLISTQQMRIVLRHLEHVLLQLAPIAVGVVGDIDIFSPYDESSLLQWNTTPTTSASRCIHDLVEIQILTQPEAAALCSWDRTINYRELGRLSSLLALYLQGLGVRPGSMIPLCFQKSSIAVMTTLAVLKAGGGFVPFDCSHPLDRLMDQYAQIEAPFILGMGITGSLWNDADVRFIDVEKVLNELDRDNSCMSTASTSLRASPNDIAYVIFTSGTTGKPKGVVMEHGAYCSAVVARASHLGCNNESRVLQFASYSFDVSIEDMMMTLIVGGCVCTPSEHDRLEKIEEYITTNNVNWLYATPSVLSLISPGHTPTLEVVYCGGEPISKGVLDRWASQVRFFRSYGPTECSVTCSAASPALIGDDPANIGYALGCQLWIVDINNPHRLAPIGVLGELLVEGAILAREYLHDRSKTEGSFIQNLAWAQQDDSNTVRRFYKTGDIVKYEPDGSIVFIRRKDTQVKLRGQRIELGEIENAIMLADPDIKNATVELINLNNNKLLAACLSKAVYQDTSGDMRVEMTASLREELILLKSCLFQTLPSYMVPTMYVMLTHTPTTTSGKIDRGKLRRLLLDIPTTEQPLYNLVSLEKQKPETEIERKMQELWASVLRIDANSIGLDDSFFRLGGDSISVIHLIASARRIGMRLEITDVLRKTSLSELSRLVSVDDLVHAGSPLHLKPFSLLKPDTSLEALLNNLSEEWSIRKDTIEDIYPCTPLQEGLLMLSSVQKGAYTCQMIFTEADLDIPRFQAAWEKVVESSELLRTSIVHIDAQPMLQIISSDTAIPWRYSESLKTYLSTDLDEVMAYGKPLARYAMIRELHQTHFVWTVHHSLYDGYSLPMILDRVNQAYEGTLLPKSVPFKTYIAYIQDVNLLDQCREYWKNYLHGATVTSFPPAPQSGRERRGNKSSLPIQLLRPAQASFTTPTIIRAAWGMVLSRYSDTVDVIFGETTSGRNAPIDEIMNIAGPTITTVPVRVQLGTKSVADYLGDVQDQRIASTPYDHYGIQNIKKFTDCELNSLLVIQPGMEVPSSRSLFQNRTMRVPRNFDSHTLIMECILNGDNLEVTVSYDEWVLNKNQVGLLLRHFEHVLQQLAQESASLTVDGIDMFTSHDEALVTKWNYSSPLQDVSRLIHEVIEEQVVKTPDSVAICSWDGQMSYRELSLLSTRLAWYFAESEAILQPGTLIPICFEKSKWATVAMLGVLKAGGAFVPLDPAHPHQRLTEILEQTEARFILGSETTETSWLSQVVPFINIPGLMENLCQQEPRSMAFAVTPKDLAYVMFTSGSTGKPKGVMIEHSAYLSGALARTAAIKRNEASRVLQFSSYSFDTSIEDTLTTLSVGGTICVPAEEQRTGDIAAFIQENSVNIIDVTPSFLSLLDPKTVPSVRTVIVGGERITGQLVQKWMPYIDSIINTYGPTETAIVATVASRFLSADDASCIGKGFGGSTWVVQSDNPHHLAPVGVCGELLIEGPILARGYLRDTVKTQASFIENPLWAQSGSNSAGTVRRFYRTGDLVKYDLDGNLIFVGRKDTQVKLHGQRIELGEIEQAILMTGSDVISQVVVEMMDLPSRGQGQVLVACFQTTLHEQSEASGPSRRVVSEMFPSISKSLENLETRLYDLLPTYMIPAIYVPVRRLPYTISGKIDRKKVRQLVLDIPTTEISVYALANNNQKRQPETESERKMQRLWADILHVDQQSIGVDESFFRVGGDSISAIRLVAAAQKNGVRIQIIDLLRKKSLRAICEDLQDEEVSGNANDSILESDMEVFALLGGPKHVQCLFDDLQAQWGLNKDDIEDAYPCTPLQEGLLTLSTRQEGAYTSQMVFALPDTIDIEQFQEAWSAASESIDILRTIIIHSVNRSLQVVLAPRGIPWRYSDTLSKYLQADQDERMDYGQALTRYGIVRERDGEHQRQFFVWTGHHAMYDGWSLPLILEKVSSVYHGSKFDATITPFKRYIKYLQNVDIGQTRLFWQKYLDAAALPSFPPAPPVENIERMGKQSTMQITLQRRSQPNFNMPTIVRAAWAVIIGNYAAVKDVVFGTTVSGRNAPVDGILSILGPTIATIPVRIQIDPDQTILGFLQKVHDEAIESVPFEHFGIQNIKKVSKDAQASCDFQSLLVIQPEAESVFTSSEDIFKPYSVEAAGNFDTYTLTIDCSLKGNDVTVIASFDENLLHRKQVEMLLHHFERVLQQLSNEAPDDTVGKLTLFGAEDQEFITAQNNTQPQKIERCIHDVIEDQVRNTPHAAAICAWDGNMTYEALGHHSAMLGRHLQSLEVKPETFIPFCFEKSIWAIVAMLGTLKSGGAFVALDPAHPKQRLHSIVQQTNATIILGSAATKHLWKESENIQFIDVPLLLQRLQHENFQHQCPELAGPALGPNNAAYIMFTSGSTGSPKGVVIEHVSYCSGALARAASIRRDSTSRLLQFSSYSFDTSIEDILTTLMVGGCVCSPSDDGRKENLASYIREAAVNNAELTPSVANLITPDEVPSLRILLLSGERMHESQLRQWADRVCLVNSYGPAECSTTCVVSRLTSKSHPANIGYGRGGIAWVVKSDDPHQLAPVGVAGEMLIEGPILARGYLNEPEKTNASFVRGLCWAQDPQRRFYKTGDLVKYDIDGSLVFLGRKDTQVKLRGQRIELGEVESAIMNAAPNILDATVELVKLPQRGQRGDDAALVACFRMADYRGQISDDGLRLNMTQELQKDLRRLEDQLLNTLPSYMIPSWFVPFDTIPTTTSDKIDRRKLRETVMNISKDQLLLYALSAFEKRQPQSELEKSMQGIWAKVLDLEDVGLVGADDSFFRLGGDSISAIRLVTAARQAGLVIPITDIFRRTTLSQLCESLESSVTNGIVAQSISNVQPLALMDIGSGDGQELFHDIETLWNIQPESVQDIYPCTPLQEGLMMLSLQQHGAYTCQNVYRLPKWIDIPTFQRAWLKVIQQTEILRTTIVHLKEHGSLQVVWNPPETMSWKSSRGLEAFIEEDRKEQIDYGDPLSRYAIIHNLETNEQNFVWTTHHTMYDGWSQPLILEQVTQAYHGEKLMEFTPFNHYIAYLKSIDVDETNKFWREYLLNASTLAFPPVQPFEHSGRKGHASQIQMSLPQPEHHTIPTLLQAAWGLLLAHYSEADDVIFGCTVSGRNAPVDGITSVIGPTICTVPLRIPLNDRSRSVFQYLQMVQDQATNVILHEHFGLQNIRRASEDARTACNFQSLLLLNMQSESGKTGDQETLFQDVSVSAASNYDTYTLAMECVIDKASNNVRLIASFDKSLIDPEQVFVLLRHFEHVIQQLSSESLKTRIDEVVLFGPYDEVLVKKWNANGESREIIERCIHEFIEEQASVQPEAPAICSWDGNMTYQELDQAATLLACYLRQELSVVPGQLITLCFHKSLWAIVTMVGIMKAGGTYVPLEPSHPQQRLDDMLAQTNSPFVLGGSTTQARWEERGTTFIDVSSTVARLQEQGYSTDVPKVQVSPSSAAYIMFTSGTTGYPKGVVIEHQAYVSGAVPRAAAIRRNQDSRVFQFSAYSFDVSVDDILITLMVGGCICSPSEIDRVNNPADFMRKTAVTDANVTPTFLDVLDTENVPSLRTVILIGECMTERNIENWAQKVHLINTYGPTECSVISTVTTRVGPTSNRANIGSALGCFVWIVDRDCHDKLAPVGTVGELLIEGPILGREYFDDSARTDAAFIHGPAWCYDQDRQVQRRFYKTGDLVRYHWDGTIVYLGRRDTQVKIRGQRLDLGEIEYHLNRFVPETIEVAVDVVSLSKSESSSNHNKFVVAFVSPSNGLQSQLQTAPQFLGHESHLISNMSGWKEHLETLLPSHMIPAVVIPLSFLPLTSSGKRYRKVLAEVAHSVAPGLLEADSQRSVAKQPIRTQMERLIQSIWAQVMKMEANKISADSNFLRLGGDSIDAMRVVAGARAEGFVLTVADIFRSSTLSELSLQCEASLKHTPDASVANGDAPSEAQWWQDEGSLMNVMSLQTGFDASQVEAVYPATDFQTSVYTSSMMRHHGWIDYLTFDFAGVVDIQRLKTACKELVDCHLILRTVFVIHGESVFQVVLRHVPLDIEMHTTQGSVGDIFPAMIKADKQQKHHLGDAITRCLILHSPSSAQTKLAIRVSHAQYDGMCYPTFFKDLMAAYSGGRMSLLPPFENYIRVTRGQRANDEWYWRNLLKDAQITTIVKHAQPHHAFSHTSIVRRSIPVSNLKKHGITFATILKVAWSVVLAQFCGQEDITFGHVVSGRNLPIEGVEEIVGPCVNIVATRTILGSSDILTIMQQVQDQHLTSMAHESFGFREAIQKCTSWPPWTQFSSVVQHQNIGGGLDTFSFGDSRCKADLLSAPTDGTDIWVMSYPETDMIRLGLNFSEALLPSRLMEHLLDRLCHNIAFMSAPDNLHKLWYATVLEDASETNGQLLDKEERVQGSRKVVPDFMSNVMLQEVQDAWKAVFPDFSERFKRPASCLNTPFYDISGGLAVAGFFVRWYQRAGIDVDLDDIVECPTMILQDMLLRRKTS